jgi:pyrophosphate--fructose-6-phosphate 1-phosphotransferase
VILSGGQAPGGHNVIAGLFDGLRAAAPESQLFGFLGGPSGLVDNKFKIFDAATIAAYRNTGGFDIIGSGRTKLETPEQFEKVAANCRTHGISALVVIGGDDSNTNAAALAEAFKAKGVPVQVIGVPKTIDGDLKNAQVETSFGFDTATKVYGELIGNIARDANSAKKYWHFIRLMGRSASHITLECALQTHPNAAIISEEVAARNETLMDIVVRLAGIIRDRAAQKCNFGVVLIPEGLIEFIPEIRKLMAELNDLLAAKTEEFGRCADNAAKIQFVLTNLSAAARPVYAALPDGIQVQLVKDRDPHGNVQVSLIETEKLLIQMVETVLKKWAADGSYTGKFAAQNHFFGYEGRCAAPSNFDADYCYSLGMTASALIAAGKTGYMAAVRRLHRPVAEWLAGGIPLTMMMNMERRKGRNVPVIRKALVELNGKPFAAFAARRDRWAVETDFVYPGPIQYFGPADVCDLPTQTLLLEQS